MLIRAQAKGEWGERIVRQWYRQNGYRFLDGNYRTRHGEIDLVFQKGEMLVFVEVKTRRAYNGVSGNDELPPAKLRRLQAAIDDYLLENDSDNWRLELAALTVFPDQTARLRRWVI
jgi:putative endonuclease